jgi:hypothetical protein
MHIHLAPVQPTALQKFFVGLFSSPALDPFKRFVVAVFILGRAMLGAMGWRISANC